jgi:hypothetical protein
MVKQRASVKVDNIDWSEAIARAKSELATAEGRVSQLKAAIRTFERNKVEGLDLGSLTEKAK